MIRTLLTATALTAIAAASAAANIPACDLISVDGPNSRLAKLVKLRNDVVMISEPGGVYVYDCDLGVCHERPVPTEDDPTKLHPQTTFIFDNRHFVVTGDLDGMTGEPVDYLYVVLGCEQWPGQP